MKSFIFKKILNGLMCLVTLFGLFCFMSCAADAGSDSDDNNTDKLVLDFNGGTMHGHKTAEFSMDDITPYVGMPIDNALAALGIAKANIKREGFYLHGWTLKKNGETCVTNLPTFGTLYAKWGTDPLPKDEDVPLNLTLNFNGGKLNNNESITFQDEELNDFKGRPISEFLRTIGFSNPEKANFIFAGWTKIKDGNDFVTNIPTSGTVTYYARWTENKRGTITLKARAGDTFYNMQGNSTTLELSFEFESGITLEDLLENKGYDYSTMVHKYEYKQTEYNFICFEDKNGIEYRKDKILTETVELSPKFESFIRPLKVVFNLNGGKLNKKGELSFENELLDHYRESSISDFLRKLYSSIPEKENFIFAGWTTIRDGNEFVSNFPSYGSYIYYAKWEAPENGIITLKAKEGDTFYNIQGNSTTSELSFEFESGITLEELLENNGYNYSTMVKGYPDGGREYIFNCFEDTKGIEYNRDKVLNGTVTIKPKFESIPQVTFDLNGGYILAEDGETELTKSIVKNIPFEDYFDSSSKIDFRPTKKGYTFAGWTLSKNGNDKINSATEDITVYAMWKDALRLFDDGDIVGEFTVNETGKFEDGHSLVYKGNGVYSYKFTYSLNMNNWGSEPGTIQFKFRPTARDWSVAFGSDGEYPTINGEKVKIAPAYGDSNLRASGLVAGYSYVITIECTEDGKYFVNIITNNLKPHAIVVMDLNGAFCNERKTMTYPISTEITFEQITSVMDIMDIIVKPGKVLKGWTYTKDGEDFVDKKQTFSEGTTTVFIKWESDTPINPSEPDYPDPIEKLTFTLDAGKGWFVLSEDDQKVKTLTTEFKSGSTFTEVFNSLPKCNTPVPFAGNLEKGGDYYSYEENGTYYYCYAYSDRKRIEVDVRSIILNVLDGIPMPNITLTENTTFYVEYRECVDVLFDLNGGYIESFSEGDGIVTSTENLDVSIGISASAGWDEIGSSMGLKRAGYVLEGFTYTKDGSDFVTEVPLEDCTIYAKWELPKECTLTINAGEYSQLFDRDGNSLGKEIKITFISRKTIEEVLEENNINLYYIVNRFEIEDALYRRNFVDSEENYYFPYDVLKDSITLYPQPTRLDEYEGILKYYDYVNDYGNYDEKAEPEYEETRDEYIFAKCLNTPHADGYTFLGWTYTPNGNDYVNLDDNIPTRVTTTVYAKWIPERPILARPIYEYSSDNSQITFTFVPSYFGYDWDSDEFHEVQLMSEAVGWDPKEKRLMTKDSNGNYTVTTDYNGVAYQNYRYYPGFKFYVYEDDAWLGPNQYKLPLSSDEIINDSDPSFKLELASSRLSLDLNGGNIEGKDLYSNFDVDEYKYINKRFSINYFIENQNLSLPVNDGYVLAGWTYTRNGNDYVDYVPGGVNTVYAKWIKPTTETITLMAGDLDGFYDVNGDFLKNEITFTFEVGITLGELLSKNDIYYDSMIKNNTTINQDVHFDNFIDSDGNVYDASKILTSSVILTAQYSVQGIVTFDLNGGQFESGKQNTTLYFYLPYWLDWYEKPTKEGYKFIGWTLTKDGDDFINSVEEPIPNGIVYAKWQDPLKLFDNGDLTGDFAVVEGELKDGTIGWVFDDSKALPLTYEGEGVYSATFTYYDYMCGWGGGNGKCQFKIRSVAGSWEGASYGVADYLDQPEVDGAEVLCGSNNASNVTVNLEDGVTYKITFRCSSDGNVYVKIATVQ